MRVFVAVVEAQGFSAASRSLGMPVPTVCRKIAELESQIGAQLLIRTTRKISVTSCGHDYYDDARRILEEVDNAERRASGEYQRASGLLTITAPSMFGRLHMLPIISDFMRLHDDIEARLLLTNHILDLPDGHIDLGVRIGETSTSSMNVEKLGTVRQVVCASRQYLSEKGVPCALGDITKHQCITFSRSGDHVAWTFAGPSRNLREINVHSKLVVNTAEAAMDAVLRNGGLTQLYSYQVASGVASGELQIVLDEFEIDPRGVTFSFPRTQRIPQKLDVFLEFATPVIRQRLLHSAEKCRV
ncbi:LysR substrate-binding domain-containing protein [Anderseniella sp. Alg231-50]|uniref:LysR substrate-binding domain-containing protein n=1 Tax=Anderseniella sp. Alg231-50 TaxID=1922226 RepID=UPI000D5529D7